MRPIPKKMRQEMSEDPFYKTCVRAYTFNCDGPITWEHALLYAGRQVNEKWAIIPLCWYHHLGKGLDKRVNIRIAFNRATEKDLKKYPRQTWQKQC